MPHRKYIKNSIYIVYRDKSKFNNGYFLPTDLISKLPHCGNSTQTTNEKGSSKKAIPIRFSSKNLDVH